MGNDASPHAWKLRREAVKTVDTLVRVIVSAIEARAKGTVKKEDLILQTGYTCGLEPPYNNMVSVVSRAFNRALNTAIWEATPRGVRHISKRDFVKNSQRQLFTIPALEHLDYLAKHVVMPYMKDLVRPLARF